MLARTLDNYLKSIMKHGRIVRGTWIDPLRPLSNKEKAEANIFIAHHPTMRTEFAHRDAYVLRRNRSGKWTISNPPPSALLLLKDCVYSLDPRFTFDRSKYGCYSLFPLEPSGASVQMQITEYLFKKQMRWCSAGRVAAGDGPDWMWFNKLKGMGTYQNDGRFIVFGKNGVVIGDVNSLKLAVTMNVKDASKWLKRNQGSFDAGIAKLLGGK